MNDNKKLAFMLRKMADYVEDVPDECVEYEINMDVPQPVLVHADGDLYRRIDPNSYWYISVTVKPLEAE